MAAEPAAAAVAGPAVDGELVFEFEWTTEAQLRQWVEAYPGRVNEGDEMSWTPLHAAVCAIHSLPLVLWLLDKMGADVNCMTYHKDLPLHFAHTTEIIVALLDHGADHTILEDDGLTPLMYQMSQMDGCGEAVKCLSEDPRSRVTVNIIGAHGFTALHHASNMTLFNGEPDDTEAALVVGFLLQAGADPEHTDSDGRTPLVCYRQRHPTHHTTIALLVRALAEAETSSFLVKVRCFVLATPALRSWQQSRLPRVALAPLAADQNNDEQTHNFRFMLQVLLGMVTGPDGMILPGDLFRVVLDFLMPTWDPLRRAGGARGQQPQQQQEPPQQQEEKEEREEEVEEQEQEEEEEGG